jgi:1-acyl-sn-glycerol-3-phosphate acyltransferase
MDTEKLLEGLNCDQRAAVLHDHSVGGPLLILAGAGSGKTSVLTRRIQYRIASHVAPGSILALTFTAKAAAEMDVRVQKLFPGAGVKLCTFHSLALSLLREKVDGVYCWEMLGFKKAPVPMETAGANFANALVHCGIRTGSLDRDALFSPEVPLRIARQLGPLHQKVFDSGGIVFEDLIYLAIQLLEQHEKVRRMVQARWIEIMVDEYQDINPSQYRLVRALLGDRQNLFVVGDDDQAIYGFRGADIGNIMRFRKDFPESTLIRLEWNYRSVPRILNLANRIFMNKSVFLRKTLRAGNGRKDALFLENRRPEVWISPDPENEIFRLIQRIKEMRMDYDLPWHAFAILVRFNRQRLYYERALGEWGIPLAEEENEASPAVEGVHVETVHGSKGLQYPVVFYAGLAEKLTPAESRGSRKVRRAQAEEERRLFYVGVTRAESCLVLLYCKQRHWKGHLVNFKPSKFLQCVEKPLLETPRMPVILFRIKVVFQILLYMLAGFFPLFFYHTFRREATQAWVDTKIQNFAQLCFKAFYLDLTVENQAVLSQVDWSRPVIVVGNHQSYMDIPVIFAALSRTIGFIAKKELTYIPFLGHWMRQIQCIFIDRENSRTGRVVQKTLKTTSQVPHVFIFPEGTRSKDGKIHSFKSGAFRLSCDLHATLLPIAIRGTRGSWEDRHSMAVQHARATILEPIDVGALLDKGPVNPRVDLLNVIHERIARALEH